MRTLVFIEQRDGEIKSQSLQTISLARELGEVCAVVAGSDIGSLPDTIKRYGARNIYVADSAHFGVYNNASYADAVVKASEQSGAEMIMMAATAMGKDLAPLVAAKKNIVAVSDVTEVKLEGEAIKIRRPIYAGKCFANIKVRMAPVVVSLRPNSWQASEAEGEGNVVALDIAASAQDPARVEYIEPEVQELDVAEASIVVSGGRGLKEAENFKHIRDLADALGGAVGASRAVVDAGWIEHKHQVGQTGKTVSPNLYIAAGISGAIQHLAGMSSSKHIVAINKDGDAPIFNIADFGIVGDLFSVIELITEKIKAAS